MMFSLRSLLGSALLAPLTHVAAAATVYLAGDSTMAATGANDGDTAGWGAYLPNYLSLSVVNDAVGGRSARSYTREGRFTSLASSLKVSWSPRPHSRRRELIGHQSGDYVVIEFGHNDGGSLTPTDNGRTDCSPVNSNYATTCTSVYE